MSLLSFVMLAFNCWILARVLATDFKRNPYYEELGRDTLIVSALNLTVFIFFAAMIGS